MRRRTPSAQHNKGHWVRDEAVTQCLICTQSFTLLIRKHHCRSCGKIFCDDCTKTRRPLLSLGYTTPVRHCDICAKDAAICDEDKINFDISQVVHTEVIANWMKLCSSTNTDELARKVERGIPNALRSIVWSGLADATNLITKNEGLYDLYKLKPNPATLPKIDLDIPRTFPFHPNFGQNGSCTHSLRNVLIAYDNFNPKLGYCQGMSFIVAVLLMQTDEENAFWVFVQMLKRYNLGSFYVEDQNTNACMHRFMDRLRDKAPLLESHMEREGCTPDIFATQWLRTLFALDFDIMKVFRLWDVFFVQEMDFAINFIVAIFIHAHDEIMKRQQHDMLLYISKQLPFEVSKNFNVLLQAAVKGGQN